MNTRYCKSSVFAPDCLCAGWQCKDGVIVKICVGETTDLYSDFNQLFK
ncbi:MAG: hypothetical protein K2I18_02745 [Paramuribaculum sp.]|nr:hypothetical protein [Paramuribaculum sp.]